MKRRNFIKLSLSVGLLSLLSGCNDSKTITPEEAIKYHSDLVSVIDIVKIHFNDSLSTMSIFGLNFNDKDNPSLDTEYSLPWYIGPKLNLSKNEYFVDLYSDTDLLFLGYGIKDRINLMLRKDTFQGISAEEKSRNLGFSSTIDLYKYVFNYISSYSATEVFVKLKNLESINAISTDKILNESFIKKENDKLIRDIFKNYISFEKEINNTVITTDSLLRKTHYTINGEKVHFIKSDFEIYTLSLIIVKEILNNTKKGIKINGR